MRLNRLTLANTVIDLESWRTKPTISAVRVNDRSVVIDGKASMTVAGNWRFTTSLSIDERTREATITMHTWAPFVPWTHHVEQTFEVQAHEGVDLRGYRLKIVDRDSKETLWSSAPVATTALATPSSTPALGIRRLERFTSNAMLDEIVANRTDPLAEQKKHPRPVAVVIYPTHDHNGAFATPSWRSLMPSHHLMYYEVSNETELKRAMADAARAGAPDVVWIGGHGKQTMLRLGDGGEDTALDVSDEIELSGLFANVPKDAHIVLDSCLTGDGRDQRWNLANMIGRMAPQTHVWSSVLETTSDTLAVVDARGRFSNPGFRAEDLGATSFVYHLSPAVTGSRVGAIFTQPVPPPMVITPPLFSGAVVPLEPVPLPTVRWPTNQPVHTPADLLAWLSTRTQEDIRLMFSGRQDPPPGVDLRPGPRSSGITEIRVSDGAQTFGIDLNHHHRTVAVYRGSHDLSLFAPFYRLVLREM